MIERRPDKFAKNKNVEQQKQKSKPRKWSLFRKPPPHTHKFDRIADKAGNIMDGVGAGLFATGVAVAGAYQEGVIDSKIQQAQIERIAADKMTAYEDELRQERKRSLVDFSPDLNEQVETEKKQREGDMVKIWLNGFSPDSSLGGASKYEYLRLHFLSESSTLPENTARSLRSLMPALVATESHFDVNAVSHTNAFSAVQSVPGTFKDWHKFGKGKELAPGTYEAQRKEFIENFSDQVEFLNWYFPYMYDRIYADEACKKELEEVQKQYFPDDQESFERYFIAPLLLNAYNAGFVTAKELVEGVEGRVRSFRETHPRSVPHQKYYAFFLLTEDTDLRNPKNADSEGRYFDKEKYDYVRRIFAFDELIAEMIRKRGPTITLASNIKKELD